MSAHVNGELAERAAQLAIARLTERLENSDELTAPQFATLAQSAARLRQLYAVLERRAHRRRGDDEDVPPIPRQLDSRTLQVIKQQVYGISP
jgi:hypothetical protein